MKVLFESLHLNGHKGGLDPETLKLEPHFVQHYKQCHMKALLRNFHFNGDTLHFHPDLKVKL